MGWEGEKQTNIAFRAATHSPDSRCIAEQGELSLGFMTGQELVQIPVLHVLCDHTERVAVDAHCQEANDVRVLQTRHDLYLFQEVVPTNIKAYA